MFSQHWLLFSKFTAVLLTIPGSVLGAYLMLAMGMLFVSGCQMVLIEIMSTRRSRLEVTLDMASIPVIDEFLVQLASKMKWNETSTLRLRSVGEETLVSMLSWSTMLRARNTRASSL